MFPKALVKEKFTSLTYNMFIEKKHLLFQFWRVSVGVGEPHHYHTAPQVITEINSFAHFPTWDERMNNETMVQMQKLELSPTSPSSEKWSAHCTWKQSCGSMHFYQGVHRQSSEPCLHGTVQTVISTPSLPWWTQFMCPQVYLQNFDYWWTQFMCPQLYLQNFDYICTTHLL